MHNSQRFFCFFALFFITTPVFSQFHTVRPKTSTKKSSTQKEEQMGDRLMFTESDILSVNISGKTTGKREEEINLPSKDGMTPQEMIKLKKYLALPIDTVIPTSDYGWREDPIDGKTKFHKGVDLRADYNYIYSIMPGMVRRSGTDKNLGNFVEIESGDFRTIYAHLYQNLVNIKQAVEAGQPIGISGSSGRSTGEHLHFQMLFKDNTIDPKPILDFIQSLADWTKNEFSHMIKEEIIKTKK
jgi:murein DD-endopeptidase MepM/ murein hydrolase activator NlpD